MTMLSLFPAGRPSVVMVTSYESTKETKRKEGGREGGWGWGWGWGCGNRCPHRYISRAGREGIWTDMQRGTDDPTGVEPAKTAQEHDLREGHGERVFPHGQWADEW